MNLLKVYHNVDDEASCRTVLLQFTPYNHSQIFMQERICLYLMDI